MRVLVADDNREIRSALRLALLELSDQWAIMEAGDAAATLTLLERQDVDVVLLDWELPGFDAATMLTQIKARAPGCTVIALSGCPEARNVSLQLGADHFVSKSDPPVNLLELLRGL